MNSENDETSKKLLDINNNTKPFSDILKFNPYNVIDLKNIKYINVYRGIKMMPILFLPSKQKNVFNLYLLKYKNAKNVMNLCRHLFSMLVIIVNIVE